MPTRIIIKGIDKGRRVGQVAADIPQAASAPSTLQGQGRVRQWASAAQGWKGSEVMARTSDRTRLRHPAPRPGAHEGERGTAERPGWPCTAPTGTSRPSSSATPPAAPWLPPPRSSPTSAASLGQGGGGSVPGAESVGHLLGLGPKAEGITQVVFDRGASCTTGGSPPWLMRRGPRTGVLNGRHTVRRAHHQGEPGGQGGQGWPSLPQLPPSRVVGGGNDLVGLGYGKIQGGQVWPCRRTSKKSGQGLFEVPLAGSTIVHPVDGKGRPFVLLGGRAQYRRHRRRRRQPHPRDGRHPGILGQVAGLLQRAPAWLPTPPIAELKMLRRPDRGCRALRGKSADEVTPGRVLRAYREHKQETDLYAREGGPDKPWPHPSEAVRRSPRWSSPRHRSAIGTKPKHRGTLRALGLLGIGQTNELPDRPEIRGMIARVPHLDPQSKRWRSDEVARAGTPNGCHQGQAPRRKRLLPGQGGRDYGHVRSCRGQNARNTVPVGFEGGRIAPDAAHPQAREVQNPFRIQYTPVQPGCAGSPPGRDEVTPLSLVEAGLARPKAPVQILGRGKCPVRSRSRQAQPSRERLKGRSPRPAVAWRGWHCRTHNGRPSIRRSALMNR